MGLGVLAGVNVWVAVSALLGVKELFGEIKAAIGGFVEVRVGEEVFVGGGVEETLWVGVTVIVFVLVRVGIAVWVDIFVAELIEVGGAVLGVEDNLSKYCVGVRFNVLVLIAFGGRTSWTRVGVGKG